MDKQLFDQAIGEVPPSRGDVTAVITRQRRAVLVRRVANPYLATAAGVVAVAVGAALAVLAGTTTSSFGAAGPRPGQTTTARPTTQVAPSPCDGGTPTGPPAPESPEVAAARLTQRLTEAVQGQLAPGTQLQPNPAAKYPPGVQHGPLEVFHISSVGHVSHGGCQGGEDYFMARANLVRAGKKGNIMVVISRPGGNASPQTSCSYGVSQEQTSCDVRSGPNGEVIVVSVLRLAGGPTVNRVEITRADGTGLIMHAENVPDDAKMGAPPQTPVPPLTHDQLVAIALSPGITLYP